MGLGSGQQWWLMVRGDEDSGLDILHDFPTSNIDLT